MQRFSNSNKVAQESEFHADFHNADVQGRLRLNCIGTVEDLARQNIELRPCSANEILDESARHNYMKIADIFSSFCVGLHILLLRISLRSGIKDGMKWKPIILIK